MAIDCDDAVACTADSCDPATGCVNDSSNCGGGDGCADACAISISSYPYSEDCDGSPVDWDNATGDDFEWALRSGSTPSRNTGPSGDHTSGSGFYLYTEASSPNYPNKTALMEGPCFELDSASGAELTFWYHMFGEIGTLSVEVSEDCTNWTTVWSRSGNQGNLWLEAIVDLSAYVGSTISIRFRGVTGSSWSGDMAIDDISVDVLAATDYAAFFECFGGPDVPLEQDCNWCDLDGDDDVDLVDAGLFVASFTEAAGTIMP